MKNLPGSVLARIDPNRVVAITPDARGEQLGFGQRLARFFGVRRRKTVAEALAEYTDPKQETSILTHWRLVMRDAEGRIKWQSQHVHNLTTDTASGYTNRRDWQAKIMGGGIAPFATMTGTATAISGTSLTNSGASFPTTGQKLSGFMVIASKNASGAGSTVFGMITTNTGTALTIDQWYAGGTWAVGTTPDAACTYIIVPGGLAAMWIAITSTATAPTSADTQIASEATTLGFSRALGSWAHTAAASTYTLANTFTSSGTFTPQVYGIVASAVANTGAMPFTSAIGTPPSMLSGDTMALTITHTIN